MEHKQEQEILHDEGSIMDIAEHIFNKPPKNPYCYRLEFEHEGTHLKNIHQELLMFFTHGMKQLYGDEHGQVNLKDLSQEQLNVMDKYMNMIGISFHYKVYEESECAKMIVENFAILETEKKNLEDHKFKIKCNDIIYVIYFSILTLRNTNNPPVNIIL
jgi:hypothetical protein